MCKIYILQNVSKIKALPYCIFVEKYLDKFLQNWVHCVCECVIGSKNKLTSHKKNYIFFSWESWLVIQTNIVVNCSLNLFEYFVMDEKTFLQDKTSKVVESKPRLFFFSGSKTLS